MSVIRISQGHGVPPFRRLHLSLRPVLPCPPVLQPFTRPSVDRFLSIGERLALGRLHESQPPNPTSPEADP